MKSVTLLHLFLLTGILPITNYSSYKNLLEHREAVVAAPNTGITVNKQLVLELVNKIRMSGVQCGDTYYYPVPPVQWNVQLEAAAFEHSKDMFQNKYFSHQANDGTKGGARIEAEGYWWSTYGENLGLGYANEKQVVEAWLKSPGHCKNIMNKSFKEMGVARVGNYWTQDFGAR